MYSSKYGQKGVLRPRGQNLKGMNQAKMPRDRRRPRIAPSAERAEGKGSSHFDHHTWVIAFATRAASWSCAANINAASARRQVSTRPAPTPLRPAPSTMKASRTPGFHLLSARPPTPKSFSRSADFAQKLQTSFLFFARNSFQKVLPFEKGNTFCKR